MKEVLLINYTGRKGGGPLDAYEITSALIAANIPVVAIVSDQIENLSLWEKLDLEELIKIPTYHNIFDAAIESLLFPIKHKRMIKEATNKYKVKYIYCPMGALWSTRINSIFPNSIKGIAIHDPIPHSGEEKRFTKKNPYRCYDYLFVHSEQFVEYVREKYNKPCTYLRLGHHDIYKKLPNKETIVTYPTDKVNFLFFGRISKYKGLDILSKAYKNVAAQLPNRVSLTIIGSGDFSAYSDSYRGIENVTIINRWIKDEETESAFLGENLICVLPYTDATQSGVALIAMDYGVPVIASNTGGISEQIEHGTTGILVPPSNVEALSQAMIELAKDRSRRDSISKNQREHMATMCWDVPAQELIKTMGINL